MSIKLAPSWVFRERNKKPLLKNRFMPSFVLVPSGDHISLSTDDINLLEVSLTKCQPCNQTTYYIGSEQPRIPMNVVGHSLVRLFVCTAHPFIPELAGKQVIQCWEIRPFWIIVQYALMPIEWIDSAFGDRKAPKPWILGHVPCFRTYSFFLLSHATINSR